MVNEILQTKGPILIRASAGTGKTYTLTKKVIHLIVEEQMNIDEILAVTFTDFASAEMRDRIYSAITEALKSETDPQKKAHLERQRVRFYRNQISTFHGFCMNLIQSYPDVAGLETEIRVMDAFQQAQFDQTVRTAFYKTYKKDAALIRLLMRFGQRDVEKTLNSVRDVSEARMEELRTSMADAWLDRMRTLHETMVTRRDGDYARLRAFVDANPGLLKSGVMLPPTFPAPYESYFTQKGALNGNTILSRGAEPDIKAEAVRLSIEMNEWCVEITALGHWLMRDEEEILAELRDPESSSVHPDTLSFHAMRDLADVALRWKQFFQAERIRTGKLIFDDLIHITHRMLVGNPDFARKIGSKFRAMVVDEFQDTDSHQWEILSSMRQDPSADLLLVGDVKQSIYEFRGGNVSVMQRVARTLPHTEFNLGQSWRSSKKLVSEINLIFRHVFPSATEKLYEAVAQDLEHPGDVKNANSMDGSVRTFWLPDPVNAKQEPIKWKAGARSDAEAWSLAQFLHGIADGTVSGYDDIRQNILNGEKAVGILLPSRKTQWKFEQALRDVGLPFASFSGNEFYQTQVVSDALALIRFLSDAYQNLATAAVFRSPFVGFSDVALVLMRDNAASHVLFNVVRDWRETPHAELPDEDRLVIDSAIPWLFELRKKVKTERLSDILTEAFFSRSYLVSETEPAQTIANCEKLIRIVRELEQQGTGSLVDVDEFLTRQREDQVDEREGMVADAGSIQFMTIHGSKGLEFPMVVLPGLGARKPSDSGIVVRSPRDIPDSETWVVPKGLNRLEKEIYKGAMYHQVREDVVLRQEAEQKRLFYVACTRARNHLVFWGLESKESKGCLADLLPEDYYEDRYEPIPDAWLSAPNPRAAEHPSQELGDRSLLEARLADADRGVILPSQAGKNDEYVTGAGNWVALHPSEAGTLIHKVLEHVGWTDVDWVKVERLMRRLWPHPSLDKQDFAGVMSHVRRAVIALGARFSNPTLRRHEVAFETHVKGVIDLLIQDSAGEWHVVDFKSGVAKDNVAVYQEQLELYRQALEAISEGAIRIRKEHLLILSTETGELLEMSGF